MEISASDIYEWTAGGYFIVHSAYGMMGDVGVGATEMKGTLSDDGMTMEAHHERTEDGETWIPTMNVTLTKV